MDSESLPIPPCTVPKPDAEDPFSRFPCAAHTAQLEKIVDYQNRIYTCLVGDKEMGQIGLVKTVKAQGDRLTLVEINYEAELVRKQGEKKVIVTAGSVASWIAGIIIAMAALLDLGLRLKDVLAPTPIQVRYDPIVSEGTAGPTQPNTH